MLSAISIKNFGLIDDISIDFTGGLNIMTGETGAGKSIIIDALRFALGERIKQSQIRDRSGDCFVEAVFDLPERYFREYPSFYEYISDEDASLVLARTYTPDGRNRIKLNGFSLTVSQLKGLGDHLVDFHGANDHQLLLSSESHINILDRLCDMSALQKDYFSAYTGYSALIKQQKDIVELSKTRERDIDILRHQIKELEQVPLSEEDFRKYTEEGARIRNKESLYEYVKVLLQILENDNTGISENVRKSFTPAENLAGLDPGMAGLIDTLYDLQETADSLIAELNEYADGLTYEPDEAENVAAIIDIYHEIRRKYGPSLDDARAFYDGIKKKYDMLVDYEHNTKDLRKAIKRGETALLDLAGGITRERRKAAARLKKTIENELKELGIKHVQFECRITKTDISRSGCDDVVFYISPNAGEDLKPLSEIVSSGEAARLMLALKKALMDVDPIPVLIFDEIDAQIGGRLGTVTGKKLKDLSSRRQVILITHLPQIASFGDAHYKVAKTVKDNKTFTGARRIEGESRVNELAAMMSGDAETAISIKHARAMLENAAGA